MKKVTAKEAGLTKHRQYELIFTKLLERKMLATREIYSVINEELQANNQELSEDGEHTLRRLINHTATRDGYIYPHDKENPGWRLTPKGREFILSLNSKQQVEGKNVEQLIVDKKEIEQPSAIVSSTQEQYVESIINSPETSETIYAKVKVRGNPQQLFRKALLKVYNYSCAFCGLTFDEALEASHIIPYSTSKANQRLDVRNGLLLCSTHHKLFDNGLLTVNQDYTIKYFDLTDETDRHSIYDRLHTIELHGKKINLPTDNKHLPNKDFLKIHQQEKMTRKTVNKV